MKCSFGISNFLEEISSLSHSIFLYFFFFFYIDHWGMLSYLSQALLWNSVFKWEYLSFSPLPFTSLLSSAICKASSDNHLAFLHVFFLGMVLITVSCTMVGTSIHSSSGTVSVLIPWIYLSLPLYDHKVFDLGYTWFTICKIDCQLEFTVCCRKLKQRLCINLAWWDGEWDRREAQEGGDICIPMANSWWGLIENNKIM